jgi:hypothetical protein
MGQDVLRNGESAHEGQSAAQTRNLPLKKTKHAAWVNSILPFNVALGPMGTLIQLLILNMHGTVIDVSLAITLSNAVIVPAAVAWGFVADRHKCSI